MHYFTVLLPAAHVFASSPCQRTMAPAFSLARGVAMGGSVHACRLISRALASPLPDNLVSRLPPLNRIPSSDSIANLPGVRGEYGRPVTRTELLWQ
jgi:hypothetical protein